MKAILMSAFLCLSIDMCAHAQISDRSIKIYPKIVNSAKVQANQDGPYQINDSNKVIATAKGGEISQCDPKYGQSSEARGEADAVFRKLGELGVEIDFKSIASAKGGHYRTCITSDPTGLSQQACSSGLCPGNFPNDRRADATATSRVILEFKFPDAATPSYLIKISRVAGNGELRATLKDFNNNEMSIFGPDNNDPILTYAKAKSYFLTLSLSTSASEIGQKSTLIESDATARIELLPLPDLYGKAREGFIKDGIETSAYEYVGALIVGDYLHCSGTVIGPHTVLTAAHCIHRHIPSIQANQMRFVFGKYTNQYDGKAYLVSDTGFDYPTGGDNDNGLKYVDEYDDRTKHYAPVKDDIAVIYLSEKLPVDAPKIHEGKPSWAEISGKISMTFVGYGSTLDSKGNPARSGVKREGTWGVKDIQDKTFSYRLTSQSTCMGDSGGPSLLTDSNKNEFITGVTSSGTTDCSAGINMRVDAYKEWIMKRIR